MVVGVTPMDWLGLGSGSVLTDVTEVVDALVGCGDFEIGAVLDNRLEDVTYISILKDLDALVDNLNI